MAFFMNFASGTVQITRFCDQFTLTLEIRNQGLTTIWQFCDETEAASFRTSADKVNCPLSKINSVNEQKNSLNTLVPDIFTLLIYYQSTSELCFKRSEESRRAYTAEKSWSTTLILYQSRPCWGGGR